MKTKNGWGGKLYVTCILSWLKKEWSVIDLPVSLLVDICMFTSV